MNIRLFYCGEETHGMNIAVQAKTGAVFGPYADAPCVLESYRDFAALLPPFAESLNAADLTVLFAGAADYRALKRQIFDVLHLKCEISVDVLELLPGELSAVERELLSLFPVNAVIFPSPSGVHSAYCCRAGRHYFIFCPVSDSLPWIVERDISRWLAVKFSDAPMRYEPRMKLCLDAAHILYDRHLTVGVADTATAGFLRTPAAAAGKYSGCFKFSTEKTGGTQGSPQDFVARIAGNAAWECNTDLGIAMSNVYRLQKNDREQHVVYISVSYDNTVSVSRVYAGGAEMSDFLKQAATELFALLICTVTAYFVKSDRDDFDVF